MYLLNWYTQNISLNDIVFAIDHNEHMFIGQISKSIFDPNVLIIFDLVTDTMHSLIKSKVCKLDENIIKNSIVKSDEKYGVDFLGNDICKNQMVVAYGYNKVHEYFSFWYGKLLDIEDEYLTKVIYFDSKNYGGYIHLFPKNTAFNKIIVIDENVKQRIMYWKLKHGNQ